MQMTKINRTELAKLKKAALATMGLRRGRVEYGTRLVNGRESADSLIWGENSDLHDLYPVNLLTRAEVAGAVVLDLYVYSAGADGELQGNVDAVFRDGTFFGCADPFTQHDQRVALLRKARA
jgi:hypothetical protein